ncbi:hypothetical protein MHYP_G00141460 [Metynnis hypsauchen]
MKFGGVSSIFPQLFLHQVGFIRLKTSLEERSSCQLKRNVLELSCCSDTHNQKKKRVGGEKKQESRKKTRV